MLIQPNQGETFPPQAEQQHGSPHKVGIGRYWPLAPHLKPTSHPQILYKRKKK